MPEKELKRFGEEQGVQKKKNSIQVIMSKISSHQMARTDLADGEVTSLKSPVKPLVTFQYLTECCKTKTIKPPVSLPFRNGTEDVPSTAGSEHALEDAKPLRPNHS